MSYPGDVPCLLRVDGTAKRKEHSAKRKTDKVLSHKFSPISYRLLSAPCALRFFTELSYPSLLTESRRRLASLQSVHFLTGLTVAHAADYNPTHHGENT